jgi:hypothetical protein
LCFFALFSFSKIELINARAGSEQSGKPTPPTSVLGAVGMIPITSISFKRYLRDIVKE